MALRKRDRQAMMSPSLRNGISSPNRVSRFSTTTPRLIPGDLSLSVWCLPGAASAPHDVALELTIVRWERSRATASFSGAADKKSDIYKTVDRANIQLELQDDAVTY